MHLALDHVKSLITRPPSSGLQNSDCVVDGHIHASVLGYPNRKQLGFTRNTYASMVPLTLTHHTPSPFRWKHCLLSNMLVQCHSWPSLAMVFGQPITLACKVMEAGSVYLSQTTFSGPAEVWQYNAEASCFTALYGDTLLLFKVKSMQKGHHS